MLYLDYSRKPGEWVPNVFGGRENLAAAALRLAAQGAMQSLGYISKEPMYRRYHQGMVTFSMVYASWPGVSKPTYTGGLGFGFKWNMGWMLDLLTVQRILSSSAMVAVPGKRS